MASLFEGVERFTPAFTGQELAIEAGKAQAQAFVSGFSAGKGGGGGGMGGGMGALNQWSSRRQSVLGGGGDFGGETAFPDSIY